MTKTKTHIDIYEKHNYDPVRQKTKVVEADRLLSNISTIKLKSRSKLLDVGCGIGTIGARVGERYNLEVHGIDIAKSAVDLSKKLGIKAKIADLDSVWPYKDKTFDSILGVQVLEHVFNPDNFLLESHRILKKNGLLILTTPNLAAWYNRILFLFGYQPFFTEVSTRDKTMGLKFTRKMTPNRETLGHIRVFPLRSLKDMLEEYGFELVLVKGSDVDYMPLFIRVFDKVISKIPSLASDLVVVAKKK